MYYSDMFRSFFTQIVRMKLTKFTLAQTIPFISYSIILVHCLALNTILLFTDAFRTISSAYTLMMTRDRLEARLWQKKKKIYIYIFFLIIKATDMHSFSNLFDKVLNMFRTGTLSIVRSISTLYTGNRYLSC